jgi:hypothetical protein
VSALLQSECRHTTLSARAEGLSIWATRRLLSVDKDTVNHWLPGLGQHCQGVMNYFCRNLHLHECQLDELLSLRVPPKLLWA